MSIDKKYYVTIDFGSIQIEVDAKSAKDAEQYVNDLAEDGQINHDEWWIAEVTDDRGNIYCEGEE